MIRLYGSAEAVDVLGAEVSMEQWEYELMRKLERKYYEGRRKDEWKDLKYLGIRIVLVFILGVVVLLIW